jgi:hypothetical protein
MADGLLTGRISVVARDSTRIAGSAQFSMVDPIMSRRFMLARNWGARRDKPVKMKRLLAKWALA